MTPRVDLVIATHNGAERLGQTLQSLMEQSLPSSEWRLILVLNACSDHSRDVAERFLGRLPLEIVDVQTPGKSRALNAVIPMLRADLIAFTDDDVVVDRQWLAELIAAAAAQPAFDVFTGKIVGRWERQPSAKLKAWIPLGSTYAVNETPDSGPCEPGMVWGPNTLYRRSVFDAGHRYNEAIGLQPGKLYPMGQDTEMAERVCAAGHRAYYVASAAVEHSIKASTVSEEWVVRRAERLAYGLFAVNAGKGYRRRLPAFVPLSVEILLLRGFWTAAYPLATLLPETKRRFWTKWMYFYFRGLSTGYRRFSSVPSTDK